MPSLTLSLPDLGYTLVPEPVKLSICQVLALGESPEAYSKFEAGIELDLGIIRAEIRHTNSEPGRKDTEYKTRPPSSGTPNQRSTGRDGRGRLI